mgnify:CR=1 FL=1
MQHRRPELILELDDLTHRVNQNPNTLVRRDLGRMINHALELADRMDRELVNSRRLRRYTHEYGELERELESQIQTVSKYLVWAHLRF